MFMIFSFCFIFLSLTSSKSTPLSLVPDDPLFTFHHFSKTEPLINATQFPYNNINGPSLIKVPKFIKNRLGKYYLYFAHHRGKFIRMAYSNNIKGPYTIYTPGTLTLSQVQDSSNNQTFQDHIASPQVIIDYSTRKLYMYFHGRHLQYPLQTTGLAISTDGLHWTPSNQLVFPGAYMKEFRYNNQIYAFIRKLRIPCFVISTKYEISKNEIIFNDSFIFNFEQLINGVNSTMFIRHFDLLVDENRCYNDGKDRLHIFYSRIFDTPERILRVTLLLNKDKSHKEWVLEENIAYEVVRAKYGYEGGNLAVTTSQGGPINERVNQLRDPGLYLENKNMYLLYSIAGEAGIGGGTLSCKRRKWRHKGKGKGKGGGRHLLSENGCHSVLAWNNVLFFIVFWAISLFFV